MKKLIGKFLIIIVTCTSCIAMVFYMVGCARDVNINDSKENGQSSTLSGEPVSVDYNIVLESTLYSGGKDFICVCRSLDEFKNTCIKNGYDFFTDSCENNLYNTRQGKQLRQLTAEDFENKVFIACAFFMTSDSGQYRIEDFEIIGDKLTMHIRHPQSDTANDVICYPFLLAEIDALKVSWVTQADYVIA